MVYWDICLLQQIYTNSLVALERGKCLKIFSKTPKVSKLHRVITPIASLNMMQIFDTLGEWFLLYLITNNHNRKLMTPTFAL